MVRGYVFTLKRRASLKKARETWKRMKPKLREKIHVKKMKGQYLEAPLRTKEYLKESAKRKREAWRDRSIKARVKGVGGMKRTRKL